MSILETYPTNYAWSNRLLDTTYSGPCVTVRRDDGDPQTDPTQVINYVNGVIDQSSLESFLGAQDGFVTVAHVPQGTDDYIQTDPALQPYINKRQDFLGLAQITFGLNGHEGPLFIDTAIDFGRFSFYAHCQYLGSEYGNTGFRTRHRLFGSYANSIERGEPTITGLESTVGSGYDQYAIYVEGTSSDTPIVFTNNFGEDESVEKLISGKVDVRTDDVASVYYNQSIIYENEPIVSAGGSGIAMVKEVGLGQIHISSFLHYPETQHDATTRQEIETFLLNEPYVSGAITKDGVVQQGVVVQVTAYDDYTMATGKEVVGDYTTDANGVITIPNADVPTGKRLFLSPHYNDAGTLSSAQGKFVSDTF